MQYLTLKKTLDFINHKFLSSKLTLYEVQGSPLTWLSDYLSNRSQKTKINGVSSDTKQILAGCSQGSVLSEL